MLWRFRQELAEFIINPRSYFKSKYSKSSIGKAHVNLLGDREIEWTYIVARIGRYASEKSKILDFGCGTGILSFAAASVGASVLAIDLMPQQFQSGYPNLEYQQVDIMSLDDNKKFDLILNCSTIEHVGLSGRYNAVEKTDGDLEAMQKMRKLLVPEGYMLMTIPMGQDIVIRPLHRIYGIKRFPRLIEGYQVLESSFWKKDEQNVWIPCSQEKALAELGNEHYYALGLMVLKVA
jgi:SAM-dependent methyltransferase